ncbi:MAG: RNA-binding protein [Chthoniobacterales bacterium]
MNDDSYHNSYPPSYRNHSSNPALESREIQVERKFFTAQIRENERGKFLRLTEEAQGRRNTVIVPSSGFADFANLINDILSTEAAKR